MNKLSADTSYQILFYLIDAKCICCLNIYENLKPILVNKFYYGLMIEFIKMKRLETNICFKPKDFLNSLIGTRVFDRSYPENYGYPNSTLVSIINKLKDWKCMTHPPKGIVINEKVKKEWYEKIKYMSRQLSQSNSAYRNIQKSVTVHFDTPQELTKFMIFMVKLDLIMNYSYHTCCSGNGIMWNLNRYFLPTDD